MKVMDSFYPDSKGLRFYFGRVPSNPNGLSLYVYLVVEEDGKWNRYFLTPTGETGFQWERKPEKWDALGVPTMFLSNGAAQQIVDELWLAGIRPSEGTGSAGALKAREDHLKDLEVVADKLFDLLKGVLVSTPPPSAFRGLPGEPERQDLLGGVSQWGEVYIRNLRPETTGP